MLTKFFSIIKRKLTKISSGEETDDTSETLEDPFLEFIIQVNSHGDFAIAAECYRTDEENAVFIGTMMYLLNSGMLSDHFVDALRLCSEGDEDKLRLMMRSMEHWKEMYDTEVAQAPDSKDAVSPKDVFSFYQMRPPS